MNVSIISPSEKFELWPETTRKSFATEFGNAYNTEFNTLYFVNITIEEPGSDFTLIDNKNNKLFVNHKFIGSEKREYLKRIIGGAMPTQERISKSLRDAINKNFPKDIILLLDFRFPNFDPRDLEVAKNDFDLNYFLNN